MVEQHKINQAKQEGADAYIDGRPASANPYRASRHNDLNIAWNNGWLEADPDAMLAARGGK